MTEEVMEAIRWWQDWKQFGCLPYPGQLLATQPAFIYDTIRLCENVYNEAIAESNACRQSA